ncbi:uncharacterized protein LOC106651734 [Trichogramma pretiosum]|uniref:uncharacterized protein LOC106651734 n=1 Tax=Trichogramma pretiosum TaxID=7493 RepID=UPI0006C9DB9F|nr:uncharacterized protein LOC106651734 [Trichogramma pretiosum]
MPPRHEVATLCDLALMALGRLVVEFGRSLVAPTARLAARLDRASAQSYLHAMLRAMRAQLAASVPWHLYDRMALVALEAVSEHIARTTADRHRLQSQRFLHEMSVAVNLTRVVVHPHLKRIELSAWPRIMRHALYDSLAGMSGLEVLDLGSGSVGWRTSDIERLIVRALGRMRRLRSFTLCFDCTDQLIAALCRSCPRSLRKLDATASRSVTDRSVGYLLDCPQLREIRLSSTSVSPRGWAELLLRHPSLEDIGRYDELGRALELVRERNPAKRLFGLRSFECRHIGLEQLRLLVDTCPRISGLCILRDERVADLSMLAALSELRELKLLSCDFYAHGLGRLLEVCGGQLESLHLEHVGELDLQALVHVSQHCPRLRSLTFYNCEFLTAAEPRQLLQTSRLQVAPFLRLERLKCVVDCAEAHLEFVLSHCLNVRFIHLGSSTGVGDATMRRVLAKNRMAKLEELKIIYGAELSMATVHLLLRNCQRLARLSELESWDGISPPELDAFRQRVRDNNFKLDTSPTLSLA